MRTELSYTANGVWTGNKLSTGQIQTDHLSVDISRPQQLGGPGAATNPEELLLAAAAGCYLITLSSLLTNRQLPYLRIELKSIAFIEHDHGNRIDKIEHHVTIVVDQAVDEVQLIALANHAEHTCTVSTALRGNIGVKVIPNVLIQTTSP